MAAPVNERTMAIGAGFAQSIWIWLALAAVYLVAALPVLLWGAMPPLVVALSLGLAAGLIALGVIDIRTERLPDWLTLPLIAGGLAATWLIGLQELPWHLLAAIAGYCLILVTALIYRWFRNREGIGLGDGKLLAAAGAWLGLGALPTVLLLACLIALIQALLVSVGTGRMDPARRLPFGPALAMATWIVWLYGAPDAVYQRWL